MKLLRKSNLLFFGLALVLCLVSFSGNTYETGPITFNTELVVTKSTTSKRFSIPYNKVDQIITASFSKYTYSSFYAFKVSQNSKHFTAFKDYTNRTLTVKTKQLQNKLHATFKHNTLYEDLIV